MNALYMSLEKSAGRHTENTFRIYRSCNHNVSMNLNRNKLANVLRDIMSKKILTDFGLREIKEKVIAEVEDVDYGNVGIRKRYVDQRENVNHSGALDDIPIDDGFEDEFELVGEGNHNMSYHITGNNIIMSHPSVIENSKTNSNPKNERVIKLEKKTMMLSILRLVTKSLRLLKKLELLV